MTKPLEVAVVGGGPRFLGLLDSLCANVSEFLPADRELVVHVYDPYPVGGGRVWRRDQPALLWMNTPVDTVTIFGDESCRLVGPLRPGPTLHEWVLDHREDLLTDPQLAEEVSGLTGATFASRPLQSAYLAWAFHHLLETAPANVRVEVHTDTVTDLQDREDGRQVVTTAAGSSSVVDRVVLAQGHLDDEPGGREIALQGFADRHGLLYVPPAYTADCDTERVPAGENVLVNGMGLAFVDWMVLLGETRGGKFVAEPSTAGGSRLRYLPSGSEPRLFVGSRRGVAYHPKVVQPLRSPLAPLPRFFSRETLVARHGDPVQADFWTELWPLACREIAYAHYHELFHSHPALVTMSWADFLVAYERCLDDDHALRELVSAAVPDPRDRFDVAHLEGPLTGSATGPDAVHELVRELNDERLDRMTDPRASVDSAVVKAFFSVYEVFGDLVRRRDLPAATVVECIDGWLHGVFSHVTSGPPPERLAQLSAMAAAGVVTFLGDGTRVRADENDGSFVATSRAWTEPVRARTLIDARLPPADVRRTVDRLVRTLVDRRELVDDLGGVRSGRIDVDATGRLMTGTGDPHPARWAVGPWVVGAGWAHAFPRPRIDAGFFRQNDLLARAVLAPRPQRAP